MNQVNPVKQLNQVKPANQVKQVKQVNKVNQVNQVKQVKRKKKEKKEREFLAGGQRDQSMVVQDVLADLKIISRRVVWGELFIGRTREYFGSTKSPSRNNTKLKDLQDQAQTLHLGLS